MTELGSAEAAVDDHHARPRVRPALSAGIRERTSRLGSCGKGAGHPYGRIFEASESLRILLVEDPPDNWTFILAI